MRTLVAVLALGACGGAAPEPATPADPAKPPCFPDGPPLQARALYDRFEQHAMAAYGEQALPAEPYGTCTMHDRELRAADGTVVAEITCGVRILSRGIRDDLGLELGALGRDVLDRQQARTRFFCISNGPGQARCSFERSDENDLDGTSYIVAGDVDDVIVGADAEAFFAPKTLVEIHTSVWCH